MADRVAQHLFPASVSRRCLSVQNIFSDAHFSNGPCEVQYGTVACYVGVVTTVEETPSRRKLILRVTSVNRPISIRIVRSTYLGVPTSVSFHLHLIIIRSGLELVETFSWLIVFCGEILVSYRGHDGRWSAANVHPFAAEDELGRFTASARFCLSKYDIKSCSKLMNTVRPAVPWLVLLSTSS